MRSILIVALAAVAFGAFMLVTHRRADDILAREERALARLRKLGAAGPAAASEQGGYRFEWRTAGNLPPVLVAQPLRHGEDGYRWFVTRDGAGFYEYDTVVHRARQNRPDVDALRRHLALPEADAEEARMPFGWWRRDPAR